MCSKVNLIISEKTAAPKRQRSFLLSTLFLFCAMVRLCPSLPPHVVGIFQQLGQAQYSHKRREILGRNLVKGNLHLVTELVDHPFLITAQLHSTVKLFLDLCKSRLRIGGSAIGDLGLTNILNDAVQIIMNRVAEKSFSCTCPSSSVRT